MFWDSGYDKWNTAEFKERLRINRATFEYILEKITPAVIKIPTVMEPHPMEPHPMEPHPMEPHPMEPHPMESHPMEPHPMEPHPMEPHPMEPHPMEPHPMEPHPMEPHPMEPHPMEPHRPLALTLYRLGRGCSFRVTSDLFGVSVASAVATCNKVIHPWQICILNHDI